MWCRREIENYFCAEDVLLAYARYDLPDDLFGEAEKQKRVNAMRAAIDEVAAALRTLEKPDPWSSDIKASDDFLEPVFRAFFKKLGLPLTLRKSDYHVLARFLPKDKTDPEVAEKLAAIDAVSRSAKPRAN
jgi:hypothetical protein